ncbi:MAG: 16S rRNA (uracil(1498)-N(3))-methyltransferase [Mariprofundaceae bacterium]
MSCRLYVDQALECGQSISLPEDQGHYLRHVMRLQPGEPLTLFNAKGGEYLGYIEQLSRRESIIRLETWNDVHRETGYHMHVVQAACRSEKIDTVLQKGTELGAASFRIVRSERSSLKLDGPRLQKRLDRWQKIIVEAAEQSGRTRLPPVSWCSGLQEIGLAGGDTGCLALILHPEATSDFSTLSRQIRDASDISLAIGPEGGWSRRDIDILEQQGFSGLAFGPRILRTETAAPALLAAIQAIRELP